MWQLQAPKTIRPNHSHGAWSHYHMIYEESSYIRPNKTKYKTNKQNFAQTRGWAAGKSGIRGSRWSIGQKSEKVV
jgi:hypothetical protein